MRSVTKWWYALSDSKRLSGLRAGFLGAVVLMGIGVAEVLAVDWDLAGDQRLQLHGFLSLTGISSTGNNFFGNTEDDLAWDFHELGLNASWAITPEFQLSGQILSRRAGRTDDGDPTLDYGFADIGVVSGLNSRAGIRLGRIKNPMGFYNDTRDVPMTRPSIFLPQSIYFDRTRTLALSLDGLQLYGQFFGDASDLSFELSIGQPLDDDNLELAAFGRELPGKLKSGTSYVGRLTYTPYQDLTLAASVVNVPIDYKPSASGPDLPPGSLPLRTLILSLRYDWSSFTFTSEYARRFTKSSGFEPILESRDNEGESFYLQGQYRFHPRWELVVRYDALFNDRGDRDGSRYAAETGGPAFTRFAKDITLGVRWDPVKSVMLRAEAHFIDGVGWLPSADNLDNEDIQQYWSVFSLSGTYYF